MAQYYDTDRLIASIKRRINIPENQITFDAADILAFADEELSLAVVPAIMSLHEDYLLFDETVPLVEGQNDYEIPYRAVGNKLYDVQYKDNNGAICEMVRLKDSDKPYFQYTPAINSHYAYYLKNNNIVLMPNLPEGNTVTGSLVLVYYIRPSQLVAVNRIGVITNIDRNSGIIAVASMPDEFDTAQLYDFYKVKSPHSILEIDKTAVAVNTSLNTIEFNPDDIPEKLQVGDHLAISTECCIPQIPSDLHVFLAQKTAERILEAQGDAEGLQLAKIKSAEMEVQAGNIIDNRVEESPIKLVNRNGPLRTGMRNRRYNRRG